MKKRIIITGSSFAGYTTAVTLAKLLSGKHEIIVIDKKPDFIFLPSFVWYPFSTLKSDSFSFDMRPFYEELGITFIQENVYGFDLENQFIYTRDKDIEYDYLVIATGTRPRYESIKGLNPGENSWSICEPEQAIKTRAAWTEFLNNPGPVVIGAAQWAAYFFAAYEFLLNTVHQLEQHKLPGRIPVHFVTSEPYLCHFGLGKFSRKPQPCSAFFENFGIETYINAEIHEVKPHKVVLEDGTHLESAFTMIIPPFIGTNAVRTTRKLADEHGLIKVTSEFYHPKFRNVYAAGGSVSIPQINETPIGLGVPRTQSSSELMAVAVARNLASDIEGGDRVSISTHKLYEYSRNDLDYLTKAFLNKNTAGTQSLDFIANGSQDRWAELTMKRYIESSFGRENENVAAAMRKK